MRNNHKLHKKKESMYKNICLYCYKKKKKNLKSHKMANLDKKLSFESHSIDNMKLKIFQKY